MSKSISYETGLYERLRESPRYALEYLKAWSINDGSFNDFKFSIAGFILASKDIIKAYMGKKN